MATIVAGQIALGFNSGSAVSAQILPATTTPGNSAIILAGGPLGATIASAVDGNGNPLTEVGTPVTDAFVQVRQFTTGAITPGTDRATITWSASGDTFILIGEAVGDVTGVAGSLTNMPFRNLSGSTPPGDTIAVPNDASIIMSTGYTGPGGATPTFGGGTVVAPDGATLPNFDYAGFRNVATADPAEVIGWAGFPFNAEFGGWAAVFEDAGGATPIDGGGTETITYEDGTTAGMAPATVTDVVQDETGTPIANQTGIAWSWFDAFPDANAPDSSGTGETTDASGNIQLTVSTLLQVGQTGYLVIELGDGRVAVSKPAVGF
jgi:hypothetical protein